jgi:spore coat polysaccharide biosynthesis protein SpsF
MNLPNISVVVQARVGSSRFDSKIFSQVGKVPILSRIKSQFNQFNNNLVIYLATTNNPEDDSLVKHALDLGFKIFRGSENDVLNRYYNCAKQNKIDIIIRHTGDNPFIDLKLLEKSLNRILHQYSSINPLFLSTKNGCVPIGMDIEIFNFCALDFAEKNAVSKYDREHVVPILYRNLEPSQIIKLLPQYDYPISLPTPNCTIDTVEDLINANDFDLYLKNRNASIKLCYNWWKAKLLKEGCDKSKYQ